MIYKISRKAVKNVVQAVVTIEELEQHEVLAVVRYGEPNIFVGGEISGSYTRTTQTAPVLTVVGDGSSAAVSYTINAETGAFESVTVTNSGTGYTGATIALSGNSIGSGAEFEVVVDGDTNTISAVNVVSGGTGYVSDPMVVEFTLPINSYQLQTGLIIRQNFPFLESRNADLKAHAFTTHVESKLQTALDLLLDRNAEYLAEIQNTI